MLYIVGIVDVFFNKVSLCEESGNKRMKGGQGAWQGGAIAVLGYRGGVISE